MREILLIDTSVYLVLRRVPDVELDETAVRERIDTMGDTTSLLLPMATVWETGNHISRLANGGLRYQHATSFVEDVKAAISGDAPYAPTYFPDPDGFVTWLGAFPDLVKANKSLTKLGEGPSLADVSIIKEWERTCDLNQGSTVAIWSLDNDLAGYSRSGWNP